ncbi:hypothetical protein TanjilG_09270 [Lupinus angustifolius]|uniref:Uncharacterized protein n=1 Tax=Lupinus angustifolius TaxID=3871 RepID=A0A4P1QWV1_LUPAN|nr:hypothetical protein TanjilG_09270 [Lupinus angustifolius]
MEKISSQQNTSLTTQEKEQLQQVMDQWPEVFQTPKGLPPHRPFDHAINLVPGQGPVTVRP